MTRSSKWAVLTAAFILPPWIANGMAAQLANQQRPHVTQGWVAGVQRGNGQGIIRIRTTTMNNNLVGLANPVGMPTHVQQFAVGPGTQFVAVNGVSRMPISFAALRPGQRIMVQAQGQQAIGVQILARNPYAGGARRARNVGARHISHVPAANRTASGLASSPAARTTHPKQAFANRRMPSVLAAHAVRQPASKKR